DVAWRLEAEPVLLAPPGIECPACGNSGAGAGFESRLWPSPAAWSLRCQRCGAGIWARESREPRPLKDDVWSAMEELRGELGSVPAARAAADAAASERALFSQHEGGCSARTGGRTQRCKAFRSCSASSREPSAAGRSTPT